MEVMAAILPAPAAESTPIDKTLTPVVPAEDAQS